MLLPKNQAELVKHLAQFWIGTTSKSGSVFGRRQQAKDIDLISMRQQLDGGYGIFGGRPKDWAVLEFSPGRAQWVRHESWHPQQESTLHADGRYTLKVPYSDERELMGDILRFGAEVKVLAPQSLQQMIGKELTKALQRYKG